MMEPTIGSQLGNYRLISPLGAGGFADVYLGEHIYLETRAAIKVLHVSFEPASDLLDRFLTEARTIAQLRHPNIVGILEFGVEHGLPYLVMEYAPHGSLRTKHPRGSKLSSATVLSYVQQIAAALQYAHEHKVVHCDVKPENMLLGQDDRVLLSDFGIARVLQNTVQTQEVVGTIYYMAPEQFDGKPLPASDQYALGVVVYLWLCGQLPFEGGNIGEIFVKHTQKPPPSLHKLVPSISPAIERVVLKALAKEAQQRFPDVATFAAAFEDAAQLTLASGVPGLPPASSLLPISFGKNTPSALVSDDVGDADEILPLLQPVIDAIAPVVNLLGEPVEPTVSQAPGDLLAMLPAEQSSGASQWQWNVSANPTSNSSDDSSSGLLPPLVDEQKDLDQKATVLMPPLAQGEPSDSVLLTSISDILSSAKELKDDGSDVILSPQLSPSPDPSSKSDPAKAGSNDSDDFSISLPPSSSDLLPPLVNKQKDLDQEAAVPVPPTPEGEPSDSVLPTSIADILSSKEVEATRSLFFISYDESDKGRARWIAQHLRQAGLSVVPFEGTAQPGTNVAAEMRDALARAEYVIAVISPKYLQERNNQDDWTMIFKGDDAGEHGKVLPVCVRDCGQPFEQLLHTPHYINLIGLNKQAAKEGLLDGVRE